MKEQHKRPLGDEKDENVKEINGAGETDTDVDENDEEEEDDDDDDFDEVTVDFEFFDPKDIDFHGLRALLGSYLDDQPCELSDLVNTIISQRTVGTVLKTAEDEDPIGVATVLNLKRHSKLEALKQIKEFLMRSTKESAMKSNIEKAWEAEGTGLLIMERLMNVPPQLSPPLMQAIFDEIQWATEDEPTQDLRDSFKFKRYIILTRVYVDPEASKDTRALNSIDSKRQKRAGAEQPLLVYVRPEDEFMHKACEWSFAFRIESKQAGTDELQPWRLAMAVPASAVPAAREQLAAAVSAAPEPSSR